MKKPNTQTLAKPAKAKSPKAKPALSVDAKEEAGIKAIQYLQSMADKDEPYERAKKFWRSMSASERETTMHVYGMMTK